MGFEEIERGILADMIIRRDLLNKAIAELQYELEHPRPPIKIDFKAIEKEAKKDMAFLAKCERKRKFKQGYAYDSIRGRISLGEKYGKGVKQ